MTTTVATGTDSPPVRRVELAVSGMTCAACAARVEARLNKLGGVRASVNYATRVATVDASDAVSSDALCEVVARAGYEAELRTAGTEERPDADNATARSLLIRLAAAAVLFVPLSHLSVMFAVLPATRFPGWQWVLTALALPIVTWAAWPFHAAALRGLRHGTLMMDTLVSLGITAACGWSIYAMFFLDAGRAGGSGFDELIHHSGGGIYLEVAASVTTFLLAGRLYEARARRTAGQAIRDLLKAEAIQALFPKDKVETDGSAITVAWEGVTMLKILGEPGLAQRFGGAAGG